LSRPLKSPSLRDVLWVGAGTGVLFGWIEYAILLGRQRFLRDPMFEYTSYVAFSTPLMSLIAFVVLAAALYVVLRKLPHPLPWRALGFVLGGLVGYGVTGVLDLGIARWARILFAVGVALQLAGALSDEKQRAPVWLRRTAIVGVLWIAVALGLLLVNPNAASTGSLAAGQRPNVLILLLDTVRAQNLSLHGHRRETSPNLDRLASEGTSFARAIAPSGYTFTSHATLFTGRTATELAIDQWTPLPDEYPTLAEVLSAEGYASAGFMSNTIFGRRYFRLGRGFDRFERSSFRVGDLVKDAWLMAFVARRVETVAGPLVEHPFKRASEIRSDFSDWLDGIDGQPYFAFLNFMDAHGPRRPPPPFEDMYLDDGLARPASGVGPESTYDTEEQYDASIRYLDAEIGLLLDDLEARGQLDNTLVVVTSDHGEQFGDHDIFDHGNSFYAQLVWVPLIFRLPGAVAAQGVVERSVSLLDVAATVLDYVGSDAAGIAGGSLRPLIEDPESAQGREQFLISEGTTHPVRHVLSLVRDSLHYLRSGDGSVELFNLWTDPQQELDLWNQGSLRPDLTDFDGRSLELLQERAENPPGGR